GMGVLLIGFVLSFQPQYVYIAFGCLIGGFLLSQVGTYSAAIFSFQPRQHQRLERYLKGLDERYVLFNYIFPAAHVLLGPHGLMVLRLKDISGDVQYEDGRWKQKLSLLKVLAAFGSEGLRRPDREAADEAQLMQRYLEKRDPAVAENTPLTPVVVFLNPKANLTAENPPLPILRGKQIKTFLRDPERRRQLKTDDRKALLALLETELGSDIRVEEAGAEDD
ncbi:MAG: NERD domain-containing protein, partial [Chloroflexi bacterium]|nr:NERD domain-containing protein [Chloroflexota bacterium]